MLMVVALFYGAYGKPYVGLVFAYYIRYAPVFVQRLSATYDLPHRVGQRADG
jgi:hypothetical protein